MARISRGNKYLQCSWAQKSAVREHRLLTYTHYITAFGSGSVRKLWELRLRPRESTNLHRKHGYQSQIFRVDLKSRFPALRFNWNKQAVTSVSDQYRYPGRPPPAPQPFSRRTCRALSVWLITSSCNISPLAGRRLRTAICVYEIPEIHLTSGPLLKGQAGRWCSVLLLFLPFTLHLAPCSCSIAKRNWAVDAHFYDGIVSGNFSPVDSFQKNLSRVTPKQPPRRWTMSLKTTYKTMYGKKGIN